MAERPILFSGPMVRAILAGRKTQTRRVPVVTSCGVRLPALVGADDRPAPARCPYGSVGDLLWVRETWQQFFDDEMPTGRPRGPRGTLGSPATPSRTSSVFYRADGEDIPQDTFGHPRWMSSIHMPRWASRLTLEVTGVRVERLQDITEADAEAEGLSKLTKDGGRVWKYGIPDSDGLPGNDDDGWPWIDWQKDPRVAFRQLWDSINADRGAGWDAHPWVWVIEFASVSEVVRG